jgi:hypothetical protein
LSNDATDGLGCSTIARTTASWTVVILIGGGFGAFVALLRLPREIPFGPNEAANLPVLESIDNGR